MKIDRTVVTVIKFNPGELVIDFDGRKVEVITLRKVNGAVTFDGLAVEGPMGYSAQRFPLSSLTADPCNARLVEALNRSDQAEAQAQAL